MRGSFIILNLLLVLGLVAGCSRELPPEELLPRAAAALKARDFGAAEIDVKTVLQQDPENAAARSLYGQIYLERVEAGAAIGEFERSLIARPDPDTEVLLAQAQLLAGSVNEIISAWEAEDRLSVANNPEYHAVLARAYLITEDYPKARASLVKAEAAQSAYADVTRALFALRLDKKPVEARETLEAVVARDPSQAHAWSILADIARAEGDREAAVELLGKAVEANPNRLSDRLARLRLQIVMGLAEDAEPDLARLERRMPTYPPVQFLRGQLYFDSGDYENALDMFTRVLGAAPDHPGSLLLAAHANIREGNFETAQRQLTRYRSSYSEDLESGLTLAAVLVQLGEAERAEKLARKILEEHGMNTRALGILAAALAAQGLNAESAQYYAQVAELEPQSSAVLAAQGAQQFLSGDSKSGLETLEAAVGLEPQNGVAHERLIEAQLNVGDLDAAAAAAEAYVAAMESARSMVYLGRVRVRQQRLDDAGDAFRKALEISPGDPTVSANLAALAMVEGDPAAARTALDEALASNPGDLATSMRLAALQEQSQDYAGLEATLRAAMESNPAAVSPRVALARLEMLRGAPQNATPLLAPIAKDPKADSTVIELLVRAYLASNELEAAENYVRRLLDQRPDDPATLALAGQVYNGRGRFEVAEQHLRESLARFPQDVLLRKFLIESLVYQRKLELARGEIDQLPETVQDEAPMLLLRGRLALAERDPASAIPLFQRAYDEAPSAASLLFLTGAQWTAGERQKALSGLEDWLADNPNDVLVLAGVAAYEMEIGNSVAAGDYYSRLIDVTPNNVLALNNLAWLIRESDTDRALEYIQRADNLAPNMLQIKDTYAMIELERGDYERALSLNALALEAAPEAPDLLFNRAKILLRSGQGDEARELLSMLVAGPAFAMQEEARALLNGM